MVFVRLRYDFGNIGVLLRNNLNKVFKSCGHSGMIILK